MKDIFVDPNDKEVKEELKALKKEALENGGMFVSDLVKRINADRREMNKESTQRQSPLLASKN